MKNIMLLACLLFTIQHSATAQLQTNWTWSKSYKNTSHAYGLMAETDNEGNTYTIVSHPDSIAIVGIPLPGINKGMSYALLKHDAHGNLLYVTEIHSTNPNAYVYANAIDLDDSGNVYIVGEYTYSLTIGTSTMLGVSNNAEDAFIAKVDKNGNNIWMKRIGGERRDHLSDIAVTPEGDLVVTGFFSDTAHSYGNFKVSDALYGYHNFLLAKTDAAGNFKWIQYSRSGHVLINSWDTERSTGFIELGADKNIYVAGHIGNPISFDGTTYPIWGGLEMIYLAKFDSTGNYVWSDVSTPGDCHLTGMAIDREDNIYISGRYHNKYVFFRNSDTLRSDKPLPTFLVSYDSSGKTNWCRGFDSDWFQAAVPLTTDLYDNVIMTLRMGNLISYNKDTILTTHNPYNQAIFTFDKTGVISNIDTVFSTGSIRGLGTDLSNNLYISGLYATAAQIGDSTYTATKYTPYVAKREYQQIITLNGINKNIYCPDDSITVYFSNDDTVFAGNNTFHFEMSDTSGSFINPLVLGSYTTAAVTDSATFILPGSITAGTGYRVRIRSTEPIYYTMPSITFTIDTFPDKPVIIVTTVQLSVTAAGSLQWYKDGVAVQGATSATFTPQSSGIYTVSVTNNSGCSALSNMVYFAPVSIQSIEINNTITITPNPAHSTITLQGLKDARMIEVFDIVGKVVYQQNAAEPPATTIDISNLSTGNYIIRITYSNGERTTAKMVKQ